ncbi:uncharacterized protein L969DRAFT_87290 [Mixia osmundae IAM 14324]|uniref:tRNA-dihydrouridine(47) synthase [NAD(P)(+)] n=1 Tax=Mixia osmundae (strain CBS 9802 / IAM 14324 / JCM 22182 / KY 12970) TaxID=764103 RepID=G7E3E6_MIXOS|nr:uncharacterized protein L969DRAFT_87290 [Mixia osmundae IAM 14324]KEI39342.1 hypothetical protein L969DRAFT_87290 [Mixia osmundae IAM 14324]GAA97356.1 hypothetical protein E5Q_04034 [Mixia osmundae IAM 14324]
MQAEERQPYWQLRPGTAAIKEEYLLVDPYAFKALESKRANDDDAAERKTNYATQHAQTSKDTRATPGQNGSPAGPSVDAVSALETVAPLARGGSTNDHPPPRLDDRNNPHKRPRLSKAELKRQLKAERIAQGDTANVNRSRRFAKTGDAIELCFAVSRGHKCEKGDSCRYSHDLKGYLDAKEADLSTLDSSHGPTITSCPSYEALGYCIAGLKCRWLSTHTDQSGDGEGFQGLGFTIKQDDAKIRAALSEAFPNIDLPDVIGQKELDLLTACKGERNVVSTELQRDIKQGKMELPQSDAYLTSIGAETQAMRMAPKPHKGKGTQQDSPAMTPHSESVVEIHPDADTPDVPSRPAEKKRLDYRDQFYLAPLTTVGNLPFRRLCGTYGSDIHCGEMGLAYDYLTGNATEWTLVRRHPSERKFGIQIAGNKPNVLVSAAEVLAKTCPSLDFVDVNCGCPIDLVFNRGAGSALLEKAGQLGKSLIGMNRVLGDIPVTIKLRTGIKENNLVAHKLVRRAQNEWGVGAVTIHGRTRHQRYSKLANYDYIKRCVDALREASRDEDLPVIPILGNGDVYDHRTYYENLEQTGVDSIMVARGALIKPWIFTELRERRDWDISSRERLDGIRQLTEFGLEHWGSDTQGVNKTRRFVCESLSFQSRYIPVGLLEVLPPKMTDRAVAYRGRDDLETLLSSDSAADWVRITEMFLGKASESWSYTPKHKANAYDSNDAQG